MFLAVLVVCLAVSDCRIIYAGDQARVWPSQQACQAFATGMVRGAGLVYPEAHLVTWGCLELPAGLVAGDPA